MIRKGADEAVDREVRDALVVHVPDGQGRRQRVVLTQGRDPVFERVVVDLQTRNAHDHP